MTAETNLATSVPFRTRARTIDHLGREQIADVPTAVSELWKNAYDAYARAVSLHIYASTPPVAAIYDDGTGMSRTQFVEKWLVVGTESKIDNAPVPEAQRQGLPARPRQGQKGIGRLSVAALSSVVLVVSKQIGHRFVASLIDWRLFENPFIFLQDIYLPVIEFDAPEDLAAKLPDLRQSVLENVSGSAADPARQERLAQAWAQCDLLDEVRSPEASLSSRIRASAQSGMPDASHLADWAVWTGERPSGMALVMADLNSALTAWTLDGEAADEEAVESIRDSLVRTLTGFSDPYAKTDGAVMDYGVVVHKSGPPATQVSRESGYGLDFLKTLDQFIDGTVDEYGVFRGNVRAFGKDLGEVEILPAQTPPTSGRDRVGSFDIVLGAFEGNQRSSILSPDVHRQVAERAAIRSGLAIYRDGLRVMPYGRPENDYFKIEERRQMHAGREFWASRRIFGRIAISRTENPNLRDKAGREGLIDNRASQAMQLLVKDLLKTLARRYFGTDAPVRKELMPGIEAENEAAAAQSKKARSQQAATFRKTVTEKMPVLEAAARDVDVLYKELSDANAANDGDVVWSLAERVNEADTARSDLRLPPKPRNLGKFEDRYRSYRDLYGSVAGRILEVRQIWTDASERLNPRPPAEAARSHLGRAQKAVTDRLTGWRRSITSLLKAESNRVEEQVSEDLKTFYKLASPLLSEVESGRMTLKAAIQEMDGLRDRLTLEYSELYEPYQRALTQLSQGIDLEGAFAYAGAREATLERRLEQIQSLAQIGISVEILSHELATLDRRLSNSLSALAQSAPPSRALTSAKEAGAELVERLRFLSQVQVSGGEDRRVLGGTDILDYLTSFFSSMLEDRSIALTATPAFLDARFEEFPSRIFPVFINLVNNSIYWVAGRPDKRIVLDAVDGVLLLGDSGPGVDQEDRENLFELFFTRRVRGRGVGLYLCRQTLAAGGHRIDYVPDGLLKRMPGANFAISLRNGFDA